MRKRYLYEYVTTLKVKHNNVVKSKNKIIISNKFCNISKRISTNKKCKQEIFAR